MISNAKVPFGTAKFSKIKNVRYLNWEWTRRGRVDIDCPQAAARGEVDGQQLRQDAFDVEFDDGISILEPHLTIRRANKISPGAKFDRLEIEDWTKSGFFVHYANGQTAEVSWSFIHELPPKK